jgi:hypothetical protein
MSADPIVQAVAEALAPSWCEWHGMKRIDVCETCAYLEHQKQADARAAVAAARPLIEAEVREQIAVAIEAESTRFRESGFIDASLHHVIAARIARGQA